MTGAVSTDALLHTDLMISLHDRAGETFYCNPAAGTVFVQCHSNFRSRFVSKRDFDSLNYKCEEELKLLGRLPDAIKNGEIAAFYQPRICAVKGAILSVGALAHWNHPTLQQIPSARFVALAECSSLIEQLGASILKQALKR